MALVCVNDIDRPNLMENYMHIFLNKEMDSI